MSKKLIIVASCPDRSAGNDPEPLRLVLHQGPTFINAYFSYCEFHMGVMICLDQGGLCPPSVLFSFYI